MPKPKEKRLTYNQKKFIDEYVETGNATQSVKKVYGAETDNAAGVKGHKLLNNPLIAEEVEDRLRNAKNMIYTIAMTGEKEETRLKASQDICDRVEGKAITRVVQDTKLKLDIENMETEELVKLIKQ